LSAISLICGQGPALLFGLVKAGKEEILALAIKEMKHDKPVLGKYVGSDAQWNALLIQGFLWTILWALGVWLLTRTIQRAHNPQKTAAWFALALAIGIPTLVLVFNPEITFVW
jgi:hypothetical protein